MKPQQSALDFYGEMTDALAAIVDELCMQPCWVDRDAEHRGECPDYAGVNLTPPGGWCLPCRARETVTKYKRKQLERKAA